MKEETTSHVGWFILTLITFLIFGPLGFLAVIFWLCAASKTKKHNMKAEAQRHADLIAVLVGKSQNVQG